MTPGPRRLLVAAAGLAVPVLAGCLGTGTRRVDAPCREMRGSVVREMLRDTREIPVLDVRTSRARSLRGAIEIPLADLHARIRELDRYRSTPVVVVGDDGESARRACEALSEEGFRYAIFVSEGADGLFAGVRGGADDGGGPRERP